MRQGEASSHLGALNNSIIRAGAGRGQVGSGGLWVRVWVACGRVRSCEDVVSTTPCRRAQLQVRECSHPSAVQQQGLLRRPHVLQCQRSASHAHRKGAGLQGGVVQARGQ